MQLYVKKSTATEVKWTPKLATGDGALGFWAALNEACPTTQHQRCRVHKTANVLAALPDSIQGGAERDLDGGNQSPGQ